MSGVATAVVGAAVIGGYMSNQASKNAANTAAEAQGEATELAVGEDRRQFNLKFAEDQKRSEEDQRRFEDLQKQLKPYVTAGETALTKQLALGGMAGEEAQASALAEIEGSSSFQALTRQGEDALLQNASATGGVRGGNIQGALAQYRPAMLKQEMESKYSQLAQLAQSGQSAVLGGTGGGVMPMSQIPSNSANLIMQGGQSQAQAALMKGQSQANMYSGIASSVGPAIMASKF